MNHIHYNPAYLEATTWAAVNRKQVHKAIAEFAHELLLIPQQEATGIYSLSADNGIRYQFKAQRLALDHWLIDEQSIYKTHHGEVVPLNLLDFILEFQESLKLSDAVLPTYLEEISSTLCSMAYKYSHQKFSSQQLVNATFQDIEHAMTEGHPCFIANSGRTGFSALDLEQFAPEATHAFQLIWLAGHRDRTAFTCTEHLTYTQVLEQELGHNAIQNFRQKLDALNLNPNDYYFFPVHPWQWHNKLIHIFANDIAQQKMIYLDHTGDYYSAQQSIRTLYNNSNPQKFYTKTALSIINMGFMRGLSPYYMQSTPPITDWINNLLNHDVYLKTCNFEMLGEVATVGYRNLSYEPLGRTSAYNKLLAVLWRESPMAKKAAHEQVMTMAALLHIDKQGVAFLPQLIQASGLSTQQWLKAYFKSYLAPLLHCFFKHNLVFMPHGENVILRFDHSAPVGMFMKDITEEVLVYDTTTSLPEHVARLQVEATDEMQILSIFTDVFDCFFRFMSAILVEHLEFSEEEFWQLVAQCILNYQEQHPEFEAKYQRFDFFVDSFKRCCLNRLQLSNNKQMLDLSDPVNSLQLIGDLPNPIAAYKHLMAIAE